VLDYKRYANLTRSLNKPYNLESIEFRSQASHGARRGALGQSYKEQRTQK